jgi:hypothetical protein
MLRKIFLLLCALFITIIVCASNIDAINQTDSISIDTLNPYWYKTWGGSQYEGIQSLALNGSEVYIGGETMSWGAGEWDSLVLKYDTNGNYNWNRTWGKTRMDYVVSVCTKDNNSYCLSQITDTSTHENFNIRCYNSNGLLQWSKQWGGINSDFPEEIIIYNSEIYIVGVTESYGYGNADVCLLKYDLSGTLLWNKTWGISANESAWSVYVDSPGVYIVGDTNNISPDNYDILLLKYDLSGNYQWNRTWNLRDDDRGESIIVDTDGIYVAGHCSSPSGQSSVLLKYDLSGNYLWNKTWGGYYIAQGYSINKLGSNIYVCGQTSKYTPYKNDEGFVLKYDSSGTLLWEKAWGGPKNESFYSIVAVGSNLYIGGRTSSYGNGSWDALFMKTDLNGSNGTVPEIHNILSILTIASVLLVAVWVTRKR